jgi:outer membrane biosynthesis protein TonB
MMHRSIFAILFACAAVLATACEKPKEEDCKRAVANIRNLYGTANFSQGVPPQAAVRSCRGSASKESVRCIIAAKTMEELGACTGGGEFLDVMKGEAKQAPAPTQPQAPAQAQPQQAPAQEPPQQAPAQEPPQQAPAQPQQAPAQEQPATAPADQQPPPGPSGE